MRKILLLAATCLLFTLATVQVTAQKKNLTYEQVFSNPVSDINKPLPGIRGWADDDHYLEMQKNADGKMLVMSVDVKTGKAVEYTGTVPAENTPMRGQGAQAS